MPNIFEKIPLEDCFRIYDFRQDAADRASDETQFIERRIFSFPQVMQMVRQAEITDSMTVIAVLHAACWHS